MTRPRLVDVYKMWFEFWASIFRIVFGEISWKTLKEVGIEVLDYLKAFCLLVMGLGLMVAPLVMVIYINPPWSVLVAGLVTFAVTLPGLMYIGLALGEDRS